VGAAARLILFLPACLPACPPACFVGGCFGVVVARAERPGGSGGDCNRWRTQIKRKRRGLARGRERLPRVALWGWSFGRAVLFGSEARLPHGYITPFATGRLRLLQREFRGCQESHAYDNTRRTRGLQGTAPARCLYEASPNHPSHSDLFSLP